MTRQHEFDDAAPTIGTGRFQRKPRATLARIAETVESDDLRLPNEREIDELISYLTLAKRVGGLTFGQMDAFWDLNRRLMETHAAARKAYGVLGSNYMDDKYGEPDADTTAIKWLNGLTPDQLTTVVEAAHAQFKDEFPVSLDEETVGFTP